MVPGLMHCRVWGDESESGDHGKTPVGRIVDNHFATPLRAGTRYLSLRKPTWQAIG